MTLWISRHFNEQAFEQTAQRTTKEQMKKRMSIVEPVFLSDSNSCSIMEDYVVGD
jgi:hypothetical protein